MSSRIDQPTTLRLKQSMLDDELGLHVVAHRPAATLRLKQSITEAS